MDLTIVDLAVRIDWRFMQLSEAAQTIFKINECGLRIQSERPELFVMVRLVCFASGQTSPPRTTFRRELESAGCLSSAFIFQRLLLRLLKDACACDQAHPSQQQICRSSEFRPRVPASNDHSFNSTTSLNHYLGMRGFALLPINPGHKDIDCKKVFSSWPWRSIMNRFNEDGFTVFARFKDREWHDDERKIPRRNLPT
ncbi:MAG: hypothetical protein WBP97_13910 [Candidatus Sulfotelmatobacter sp.]